MSERIRGHYPGGPRRPVEGETPRPRTRVPTVDEVESAIARRTRATEQRQRRHRVTMGLGLSLLVAGTIGFGVGRAVRKPAPEIALPGHKSGLDKEISAQVNRTLLELWRMEDVEYARGRNPHR